MDAWLTEPVEPEPHLQTVLFAKVVLATASGRRHPPAGGLAAPRGDHPST